MIEDIERYITVYGHCYIDVNCNVIHPNHVRKVLNKYDGETGYYVVSSNVDDSALFDGTIMKLYRITK